MICLSNISLLRLLKRVSIILLVVYSFQLVGQESLEKEIEDDIEQVEFLHSNVVGENSSVYSDVKIATNNKDFFFSSEETSRISSGFIITTSHKLYVLFSQLLLECNYLNNSNVIFSNTTNHSNLKENSHGKFKENNRREANSYSSNLFCFNNSNCSNSSLLI